MHLSSQQKKKYFLNILKQRKTTYEFSNKQIKNSDLHTILEAGRWAPSCSNSQPWHFVVIKNKKTIATLTKTAAYGAFHTDPALLIVIILKKESWCSEEHRCIKDGKLGIYEAYLCAAMPAAFMILQAQACGIQSCILTPEYKTTSSLLKVSTGNAIPLLVGLGYEKKNAFQNKRERLSLNTLVSYETFHRKTK